MNTYDSMLLLLLVAEDKGLHTRVRGERDRERETEGKSRENALTDENTGSFVIVHTPQLKTQTTPYSEHGQEKIAYLYC